MTNEEAAKLLVAMYGKFHRVCDDAWCERCPNADCMYAEAVSMAAAALVYGKEVKPNANDKR